jgi:hypothetical protein
VNAKTAKKLRRIAAQVTVGQPYASYRWASPRARTIVLNKGCMRQVYKDLKKTVRNPAVLSIS